MSIEKSEYDLKDGTFHGVKYIQSVECAMDSDPCEIFRVFTVADDGYDHTDEEQIMDAMDGYAGIYSDELAAIKAARDLKQECVIVKERVYTSVEDYGYYFSRPATAARGESQ